MSAKEIIDKWDRAAELYATEQEKSEFACRNKETVASRFSALHGEKVLDLGCGCGNYTDFFMKIGGDPVGVDGSGKMIELARKNYPDCRFSVADVTKTLPFEDSSFDIVFCNQVLMDVEDAERVFAESYRVLKRGGIFYYSIVHPAFYDCAWQKDENGFRYGKTMTRYIAPYSFNNGFWGETVHFHRTLSYYLNAAAKVGFVLKQVEEPSGYDGVTKNADLPLFFFAEYEKI